MIYLDHSKIIDTVTEALKEDIATGDITSVNLIAKHKTIKATILAKENCVICGMPVAACAFKLIDRGIKFKSHTHDGSLVKKGSRLATISGNARSILAGERVALNFLSLLSGVSTKTQAYLKAIKPFKVKILDTRKTIPGLRFLEKYAVRIGGGFNHRMSLDEMILVKDNHINISAEMSKLAGLKSKYKIEIEVEDLEQFLKALSLKPDIIMLDNMSLKNIRKAVEIRNRSCLHRPLLEASGGISLKNIKKIAASGIDAISIGELTHSVASVDLSLEII
jgi:nicotinate-nucleotide pyrophosphorylase (carboxylating)